MPGFKFSKFFDEMRLSRSWRSLRPLREAVEVIKAAEVPDARKISQYVKCMHLLIFLRPRRLRIKNKK